MSMRRTFRTWSATTAAVVLAGCAAQTAPPSPTDPQATAPAIETPTLTRAEGKPLVLPDIPMNGLPTLALVRNLLSTNYDNSGELVRTPLSLFGNSANLTAAVNDPGTRDFMRYLVRCALPSNEVVSAGGEDMHGQLGVCADWYNGPASADCQQRVSACLLLLNNPNGVSVPLSLRGIVDADGDEMPMAPAKKPVTVQVNEDAANFTPAPGIASFNACPPNTYGVSAACGWNPSDSETGYVGTCSQGTQIAASTGAPCGPTVRGSSNGDTVLRVCDGVRGCDPGSAQEIASNDDACGSLASFVRFTCPLSGVFSVMVASYDRSRPVTATVGTYVPIGDATSHIEYPAPETSIFPQREGAFFGNIFDRTQLAVSYQAGDQWQPHTPPGAPPVGQFPTPYQGMYSCSDPSWSDANARLVDRNCATDPTTHLACASAYVGTCTVTRAPTPDTTACTNVSSSGAFMACKPPASNFPNATYSPALTSYVNATPGVSDPPRISILPLR
jgi:hypothetical protein